jgi:hypothetical protein
LAFAPDSQTLFADGGRGSQGNLFVNDLRTGQQRAIKCEPPVRTLAISPDGKTLAIGDYHANVVFRDVATMREIARFHLPDAAPPYWLIPIGGLVLWSLLWLKFRGRAAPQGRATIAQGAALGPETTNTG